MNLASLLSRATALPRYSNTMRNFRFSKPGNFPVVTTTHPSTFPNFFLFPPSSQSSIIENLNFNEKSGGEMVRLLDLLENIKRALRV